MSKSIEGDVVERDAVGFHMVRSPGQYTGASPHAIAAGSVAQIRHFVEDAKHDIARLLDELSRLRTENEALRAALQSIDAVAVDYGYFEEAARTMQEVARAALSKALGEGQ